MPEDIGVPNFSIAGLYNIEIPQKWGLNNWNRVLGGPIYCSYNKEPQNSTSIGNDLSPYITRLLVL